MSDIDARLTSIEAQLNTLLTQEQDDKPVLSAIKQERDRKIKGKVVYDAHIIGKSWYVTDEACWCGSKHKMIEVDGGTMCPIKYYLTLGRLALFDKCKTPSEELFVRLMQATTTTKELSNDV
jgi:hypothetical protein